MTEEVITPEVEEVEDERSVYDLLNLPEPDDEDEYQDEEEEQDEELLKEQKLEKKFSTKFDKLDKKFEANMLQERTRGFESSASELEVELLKTVASDIKTVADFDKAVKLVRARAEKMEAAAEEYRKNMEAQAQTQAASAWGTGPVGTPSRRNPDAEEESMKKIAAGDVDELYASLVGNDAPWMK